MQKLLHGLVADLTSVEAPKYAPVYFYGAPEQVSAVLADVQQRYETVNPGNCTLLIRGADFVEQIIRAFLENTEQAYLMQLRQADMLLLDGVEAICGHGFAEWEVFSLVDYYLERGRRIAFGAQQLPIQLNRLAERVRSQLEGCGICSVTG